MLSWYGKAKRDLPWRRSGDPYAIWVSEIMLQQTRVAAAIPFYERFMKRFPTLDALASAPESDVLVHWAGLGYYSRARNLHRASRMAAGVIPSSIAGLLALPGIGSYTAAAIGSIAFGLPVAAVDGNLLRLIARLDNDAGDIGHSATRTRFALRAQDLLDVRQPGAFNQAMMELGATVCVPKSPRCPACPVATFCKARASGRESELPIKRRKPGRVDIDATVVIIERGGKILLRQRGDEVGQMAGFWELPEVGSLTDVRVGRGLGELHHTITHHHYRYRVYLGHWDGPVRSPFAWRNPNEVLLSTAAKKALRLLGGTPAAV